MLKRKLVEVSESIDENRNPIKTETVVKDNSINNIRGLACDVCHEVFPSLAILKEHRESKHQEVLNYNCKLCVEVFKLGKEHREHEANPAHTNISTCIANQFSLHIGKICGN